MVDPRDVAGKAEEEEEEGQAITSVRPTHFCPAPCTWSSAIASRADVKALVSEPIPKRVDESTGVFLAVSLTPNPSARVVSPLTTARDSPGTSLHPLTASTKSWITFLSGRWSAASVASVEGCRRCWWWW